MTETWKLQLVVSSPHVATLLYHKLFVGSIEATQTQR